MTALQQKRTRLHELLRAAPCPEWCHVVHTPGDSDSLFHVATLAGPPALASDDGPTDKDPVVVTVEEYHALGDEHGDRDVHVHAPTQVRVTMETRAGQESTAFSLTDPVNARRLAAQLLDAASTLETILGTPTPEGLQHAQVAAFGTIVVVTHPAWTAERAAASAGEVRARLSGHV